MARIWNAYCFLIGMKTQIQLFALMIALLTALNGCNSTRYQIGEHSCISIDSMAERVSIFTCQDVLPGVESNLRKQRLYHIESDRLVNEERYEEWFLATDSVLIPLGLVSAIAGESAWAGRRNFYEETREGVPQLEVEALNQSGMDYKNEYWLVGVGKKECKAFRLPEIGQLPLIAAP
jgi:hypothetical protein